MTVDDKQNALNSIDNWVEQQIHQEFVENYNSISSYVLAFVSSLIVCFCGYGFCLNSFINGTPGFKCCLSLLLLSYIVCMGVCVAAIYLSVRQGWAMRRDQFIVHAIRLKNLGVGAFQGDSKWFPEGYHPFGKSKTGRKSDILIGTFQYIFQISVVVAAILSILTIVFLAMKTRSVEECKSLLYLIVSILVVIYFFVYFTYITRKWLKTTLIKYKKLEKEMKIYKPTTCC